MLMSLKAASLGLNLVVARHVILLDLWWNPSTEEQAIDRAHRIGQTKPVLVSRFAVKDTIEDRILELQVGGVPWAASWKVYCSTPLAASCGGPIRCEM